MQAPLPKNEVARLGVLRQCKILDTPAEKPFDEITNLAAYLCGTPIALISFIDSDRQWFKSKVGLEVTATPRKDAFCAHAILQPEALVVPDTLADKRFVNNPLVTGFPHIRFYAGVPLITVDRQALGTLCVIDYVARELTPQQLNVLKTLARQVVRQIELRRSLTELESQVARRRELSQERERFFKRISISFGLASTTLVAVGIFSYTNLMQLVENSRQVTSSRQVLALVDEVLSQMKDVETGHRGYVITGQELYLEPYQSAENIIGRKIETLRQITVAQPQRQQQLDTLEQLVDQKLVFSQQIIDLRRNQGFAAAQQLLLKGQGKELMDEMRILVREIQNQETQVLRRRSLSSQTSTRNTILSFTIGIFLNGLILALVYHWIRREISKRKYVERELEQEHDFISTVLDNVSALVVVCDTQGRIVRFNQACEQTTGYSFFEVRGKLFWDLFLLPEEQELAKSNVQKLCSGESSHHYENYWLTRSGDRRLIAWSDTVLRHAEGAVEFVISNGIDITERKRAEEALLEKQRLIEQIAEASPNVLYIYDLSIQSNIYSNRQVSAVLGYTSQEIQEMGSQFFPSLMHPDDFVQLPERMNRFIAAKGSDVIETEYRMKHADGQWRWLISRDIVFTRDADGNPQQILGTAQDITTRKQAEEALQAANQQLKNWVGELEQSSREITLLSEMSDVLQACRTLTEAYGAIASLIQPLFPHASGSVLIISASRQLVEAVATWGSELSSQQMFAPDECWALRRGRYHFIESTCTGIRCHHFHNSPTFKESLCVPMMAQGETLGLLYLNATESGQLNITKQRLAVTVAEHIAMALANLILREKLHKQSIRDPLTGLFNRRYLEESLIREVHRAARNQQSLGIIMLDVDHFKSFNDTFGHEAGDSVLRELGLFLSKQIRESDIACRYGGEELTLILPEVSLEVTRQRAEQIREGVKHLSVQHRRQPLGGITVSLGVAGFPNHGLTGKAVIQAADAALYQAKAQGRDRTIVHTYEESPELGMKYEL
jgi:diguanylate cyclase (GGDEF)-like protein/PAS domain S-box-containing protein